MPSSYQARQGGVIEIVDEQAAAEIVTDLTQQSTSTENVEAEAKFINEYMRVNANRIQVRSIVG
jgi:hypothetical protein